MDGQGVDSGVITQVAEWEHSQAAPFEDDPQPIDGPYHHAHVSVVEIKVVVVGGDHQRPSRIPLPPYLRPGNRPSRASSMSGSVVSADRRDRGCASVLECIFSMYMCINKV